MADDVQSNIGINIDTDAALASIKNLQRQISAFQQTLSKGSADQVYLGRQLQQNLINNINATGQFAASMAKINTSAESFTTALEKNKLSMGEYFRYAGGASKSFGKLFKTEFDTIGKVARERVKDLQTQYIKLGRDANGAMQAIKVRPLSLDMQNLATRTAIAAQKQQLLNQLLKQGSTNLLNFGKNTQWAGRQLMVGFTIPLSMVGTAAAKTFMDMEKQAIAFKRVYGDMFTTTEETSKALGDIRNLANEFTKYGVAVADTMELAAKAAATGKMGADLIAQVSQATKLSVLGNVDQAQALETTISLTNAFGISADKLSSKIDFLNAVENQTVTSIEDLTIAIPKAGPVIQQLGGNVEDLTFFLTAMKEGGINASEGANALKSGLASMINPTKKASEFLAGFGVNLQGIVEANKGDVKATVVNFAAALDTLDPLNRARAIEQLFGKFQFARISTLFKNVIAEGSQANKVLGLTAASAEDLAILSERELKKVSDSPMYKFQKSVEDLKTKLAPLGEAFLKAVTPIVEFGGKLLDQFNKLDDGAKNFIIGLTAVLGGIGPIAVMTFGLLANGVAQVIKGFVAVKSIFNKAGSASTVLGEEVSYMTSEQIRSASVAASLEQVHGKLIQTFTSEASAVDRLTSAYSRAVSAQAGFMGGAGAKKKKYATGVVSVPGPKGAGDIVPAMLAPGEAVIPAAMAKKYGGLIHGMIADNLPGYEKGRPGDTSVSGYGNATIFMPEGMNKALDNSSVPTKEVTAYLKKAGRAAMAPLMFAMAKEMGLKATDPKFKAEWAKVGDQLSTTVITALDKSGKQMVRDEDLEEILIPALKKTTAKINIAGKNLGEAFEKTAYNIYTANRTGSSSKNKAGADTGAGGRQPISRMAYASLRAKSQDYAIEENSSMFRREVVASKSRGTKRQFQTMGATGWDQGVMAHLTKSVTMTMDQLLAKVKPYLGDVTTRVTKVIFRDVKTSAGQAAVAAAKAAGDGYVEGAKKAAQTNSPSRRTAKVAKDTVDGYVIELEKGKKKVAAAGATTYRDPATGRFAAAPTPTLRSKVAGGLRNFGRGIGPGGIGMAASGLAMGAAMMPGPIGEAASAVQGPLFAASSALSLIPGPAKVVVAALGAVAVVAWQFNENLKKARDEGVKLANAMTMTSDKLVELSKITGTVSDTEARKKKDQTDITGLSKTELTAGQKLLQSTAGSQFLKDANAQRLSGRTSGQVGNNLGNQLATAISQGVITNEQARGLAAAIGAKMKDYSIQTSIEGTLDRLIGPNGVNLLNDPLKIRLEIQKDSMVQQATAFQNVFDNLKPTRTPGADTRMGAGTGLVALGAGMAATGAGAIPGAIVAGVGALAMGSALLEQNLAMAENNKLRAAAVQLAVKQVASNQGVIDSINADYDSQIRATSSASKRAEIEAKRSKDLAAANAQNAAQLKTLREQAALLGGQEFTTAIGAAIDETYKNADAATKTFVEQAKNDLAKLPDMITGKDGKKTQNAFKLNLELALASGDIDPLTVNTLLKAAETNKGLEAAFNLNVETNGTAATNKLIQMITASGGNMNTVTTLLNFTKKDPALFDTVQKFLVANKKYDINIDINTITGPEAQAALARIQKFENANGPINFSTITTNYYLEKNTWAYNNWAKVFGNKNVTAAVAIKYSESGADAFANWVRITHPEALKFGGVTQDALMSMFGSEYGKTLTTDAATTKAPSGTTTGGSGGEKATNLLAQVNKAIGDARLSNALSAKNIAPGLIEMLSSASKLTQDVYVKMKNGKATLTAQGQALQKAFNTKVLTEFAAGQKALQDSVKAELSTRGALIKAGFKYADAVKLGADANIQAAYAAAINTKGAVAQKKALENFFNLVRGTQAATESLRTASDVMSEYLEKNRQTSTEFYNQYVGVKRLVGMGYSLADAYSMLEDAEVAAAIAGNQISDAKLKEVLAAAKLAKDAMDLLAATKAVVDTNAATADKKEVVKRLSVSKYSDAQRKAILEDVNLQKLYLANPFSEAFVTALENAVNSGKYTIDANNLTVEGMEQNFRDAFDLAMERVNAQETKINLDFETKTKGDKSIAKIAEQNIADYNYQIDDLEASLKPIEDAENKINDQYDKRIKALDAVAAANEKISRQQQQQLGIADAITRGDIAAAAAAVQDARATEAQASIADQKVALEKNKDLSLAALVNAQGLTRTEVETKIRDLKDKIFAIEEASLEPANQRITLAERERDLALEIWEIEKDRLERASNMVNIARTDTAKYKEALGIAEGYALTLVDKYKNGGNIAPITINPSQGDGNATPAPAPTLPPTPAPTPAATPSATPAATPAPTSAATPKPVVVTPKPVVVTPKPDSAAMKADKGTLASLISQLNSLKSAGIAAAAAVTSINKQITAVKTSSASADSKARSLSALASQLSGKQYEIGQINTSIGMLNSKKITLEKKINAGGYALGGLISGGARVAFKRMGTDTVPAMLTPGEFVVKKFAVDSFGADNLKAINNGTFSGGSVYNYDVNINVRSEANVDDIARTVISEIKRVDSQRIRGNKFNG